MDLPRRRHVEPTRDKSVTRHHNGAQLALLPARGTTFEDVTPHPPWVRRLTPQAATAARALVTSHFEELTHHLHRDPKFGRREGLVRSITEFREPELPADSVVRQAGEHKYGNEMNELSRRPRLLGDGCEPRCVRVQPFLVLALF